MDTDGIHWDCANIQDDRGTVDLQDAWLSHNERDERQRLNHEIHQYWYNELPEDQQAMFVISGFFKYDEILEIDEMGDNTARFPHLYVAFKEGRPAFSFLEGWLTLAGRRTTKPTMAKQRQLLNPALEHRIERFPARFRKRFAST